jgi:serine/threonine-protein kinase
MSRVRASISVAAPPARCVVPRLAGKTVLRAKVLLRQRGCRLGAVGRAWSRSVKAGRILAQRPRAGSRLAVGAKVRVVVSRGRRR